MNCLLLLYILVLRHGLSSNPPELLGCIISSLLVWWDANNFIVSSKNYQLLFSQSDLYKIKMQPCHCPFWPFNNIFTLAKLLYDIGPLYPVLRATVSHVTAKLFLLLFAFHTWRFDTNCSFSLQSSPTFWKSVKSIKSHLNIYIYFFFPEEKLQTSRTY